MYKEASAGVNAGWGFFVSAINLTDLDPEHVPGKGL